MKILPIGCALALLLSMSTAHGVNREIRALFQPDPSQPSKNLFVNQTPNSGYCFNYPAECQENNMFSIQIPVRYTAVRPIGAGEGIGIKAPANWRQLTVTNADTQESEVVEVRISGLGSTYTLSQRVMDLTGASSDREGHQQLWTNSSWNYAAAPCLYSGVGVLTPSSYRFFWKTPVEASCVKTAAFPIPGLLFTYLDIAYELRTPNPLGMSSGLYKGSIPYSLGPMGDFQLGSMMEPNDDLLTLDFVLDVQHTLKIDLPPGGNRVALEPVGGWEPWINSGRKPTQIFRDHPFYISASSRFKVMMLCSSLGGNSCRLGSPKGDSAQVQVSMSLPSGINGAGGGPVNRIPLNFNRWMGPFQPGMYVDRKPGYLHFEMTTKDIEFLLKPGKNDRLRGNITIIWDSEA